MAHFVENATFRRQADSSTASIRSIMLGLIGSGLAACVIGALDL